MSFLNRLKIWQKLALLIAALGIPIVLLTYLLAVEKNRGIDLARQEILGVAYLQPTRMLLQHLAEHRGMSNAYLSGDASFKEKIAAKQSQIAEDIKAVDAADAQHGGTLDTASSWKAIEADWQNLGVNVFSLTAPDSFSRHTALIEKLLDHVLQVSITSNLALDPELDSYSLMDVIVNRLPFLAEHFGQLRGGAAGIVARRQISEDDHVRLAKSLGQIALMRSGIQLSLNTAFEHNGSLKPVLEARLGAIAAPSDAFIAIIEKLARSEQVDAALTPSDVFAAGTRAIEAGFALYDAVAPTLTDLLQKRVDDLNKDKFTVLGGILACVALALLLAYGIIRVIVRSRQQAG